LSLFKKTFSPFYFGVADTATQWKTWTGRTFCAKHKIPANQNHTKSLCQ